MVPRNISWRKVGKVSGSEKIKICFKIVTFKRFQRKIVTSKQILFILTYSLLFVVRLSYDPDKKIVTSKKYSEK